MDIHTKDSKKSPYTNSDYSLSEFDGNYLHVWKQKMTIIFKQKRILTIVDVIWLKFVDPTTRQIATSVPTSPTIGPSNIVKWEEQVTLVLILNNNCFKK